MSSKEKEKEKESGDKVKLLFTEGETVLCYHGPLLYEAKCVKAEIKNKSPQYFIHYSGWNKSWDEWVSCPRVLKCNEENLKKQKELLATHGTSKIMSKIKSNSRKSGIMSDSSDRSPLGADSEKAPPAETNVPSAPGSTSGMSTSAADSRRKRQKVDDASEAVEDYSIKNEVVIKLPNDLKQVLADDYHTICVQNKLVTIPAFNSVESILDDYLEYKLEKQFDRNVINEIVEGLKDYFNSALSTKLLYKFERLQFNEFFKSSNRKPSEIYGSVHFLRLFVKIGELLSYTYWDEICIKQLCLHIDDVLKYLSENRALLFSSRDYSNPYSGYVQKAVSGQ